MNNRPLGAEEIMAANIEEAMTTIKKNIEYTYEMLYHFTCPSCKRWWSYAISWGHEIEGIEVSCMHCGEKGILKLKSGF